MANHDLSNEGEVDVQQMALSQPFVLWCSAANPGATGVADELRASMSQGGAPIRVVDSKPDMRALEQNGEAGAMLLYLNQDTWIEQGEALERDVRATRNFAHVTQEGKPIEMILVHENDRRKGGCEFGLFFGTVRRRGLEPTTSRLA